MIENKVGPHRTPASVVEQDVDVALPVDGHLGRGRDARIVADVEPEPEDLDPVLGHKRRC